MKPTSIVTITNQKGGVGKTTTVINLASSFAESGQRVLCIDLDYQGNLSRSFGLKRQAQKEGRTVSDAIKQRLTINDVRMKTSHEGIDIVCAELTLVYLIQQLTGQPRQASIVKHLLDCEAAQDYDVILIDTHPSPDCLFQSAIAASHYYLVPVFAEPDPLEGVQYMIQLIDEVKEEYNPNLTFLGILVTRFSKKNKTHERFQPLLRSFAKKRNFYVFDAVIPQSDAIAAASASQVPLIFDVSKKSLPVTQAYKALADELGPKLTGKRQGRKPLSPDFEGADVLDQAFENQDFDFAVATENVSF